ncbi:ribosome maturation factor RimM [bacterium BMS3Abin02]|nr:ribosome maturation factor RimM [bacterium BMS3Abin02]GBE22446.1 ribosome maturation factor RimM [bacterium BMS3Bbin01]
MSESDSPERFVHGATFITDFDTTLVLRGVRVHKDGMLVAFEGVTDRNAAEELRGTTLFIPVDERRKLEDDEFWPEDLEGLEVRDPQGRPLGRITGVIVGDAQDRLLIHSGDRAVEVPFVEELVPDVRPESGFVTVVPIEGLFSSEPD